MARLSTSYRVSSLVEQYDWLLTLAGHPYEPTIAASGIDNTIKIFSPDRRAQHDARLGINILDPDNPANTIGRSVSGITGLKSCKRMQDSYQIMSQNDIDRQGGMNEAFITVRFPLFLWQYILTTYRGACYLDWQQP